MSDKMKFAPYYHIVIFKGCFMPTLTRTFHIYRYQLLPTIPPEQMELAFTKEEYTSIEELVSQKNEIFAHVLREQKTFRHVRAELTHLLAEVGNFIVLQIGAKRGLIRKTKDFRMEQLDTWPSVFVVINNDPNVQIMAVEEDAEAFYRTSTVVHIISTTLNERLKRYRLQWLWCINRKAGAFPLCGSKDYATG
jgi:hypothetical protein